MRNRNNNQMAKGNRKTKWYIIRFKSNQEDMNSMTLTKISAILLWLQKVQAYKLYLYKFRNW